MTDYARNPYYYSQARTFMSFEGEHHEWLDPQIEAIHQFFEGLDTRFSILDCGCGDGSGLKELKAMGFTNVVGFDLTDEKLRRASAFAPVALGDQHTLPFAGPFDVIYSSHSLEHCIHPWAVIDEFNRLLKPSGALFLIIPYPDDGNPDGHPGKFELGTNVGFPEGLQNFTQQLVHHNFYVQQLTVGYRGGPEIRLSIVKIEREN